MTSAPSWLWSGIAAFLGALGLAFVVRAATSSDEGDDGALAISIRTNRGVTVPVRLKPEWTIGDVKSKVKSVIEDGNGGDSEVDLRMILAGRELGDTVRISDCDIGHHSILHAIQVVDKSKSAKPISESSFNTAASDSRPMNKRLLDLQLTSEQKARAVSEASEEPSAERSRAHFYVLCSAVACNGMRPGKLRVRCSKCGEGAIVVHRDPCDWDDVLVAGRVTGTCSNTECDTADATVDFYFKCASLTHPSSGDAPPLNLVRSNFRDVPCLACTEVCDPVLVFPCLHVICTACFSDFCASRLNERRFELDDDLGYTLGCPIGCDESLISETRHFKLAGPEQYERYQRFAAEEFVLRSGGVLCPQPGCGMGIMPESTEAAAGSAAASNPGNRRIACAGPQGCGYVFCRDCLQGFHIGECDPAPSTSESSAPFAMATLTSSSSSLAPRWADEASMSDPSSAVAIRLTTKPCPKCRTATERAGGCMHMTCTRASCGFDWCWVCQTEWSRECMANHWFG